MLPYTPLHHLLLTETGFPIVATSGNLAEEPICTDENEAIERLAGIADLFLVHNRPIARHVDDSVVRIMAGREMVVRRARGYSPLPIRAKSAAPGLLAVGGHQKDAIAISTAGHIFVSQHIGDLATAQAYEAFRRVITDFERLYGIACRRIACDLHPDYLSTKYANGAAKRVHPVQHHVAHVASCVEENEIEGPVLGVAWDGNGHGTDGTVWGGEFLLVEGATWRRVAHLRTFLLPGGETAMREPSRAAVGLLYSLLGDEAFRLNHLPALRAFSEVELRVLKAMVERGVNSPPTSSAGRLFDAVAAIIDVRQENLFEGQAAMELEFALEGYTTDEHYDTGIDRTAGPSALPLVVDWGPMMRSILNDAARGIPLGRISAQFHNTLVEMILAVARRVGEPRVVLSGGCFQNRYLTERAIGRLREEGFAPYWHQRVPPNDGGIALGQAAMASHAVNTEGK
jgi:hydrogenase maturation protein HypF